MVVSKVRGRFILTARFFRFLPAKKGIWRKKESIESLLSGRRVRLYHTHNNFESDAGESVHKGVVFLYWSNFSLVTNCRWDSWRSAPSIQSEPLGKDVVPWETIWTTAFCAQKTTVIVNSNYIADKEDICQTYRWALHLEKRCTFHIKFS